MRWRIIWLPIMLPGIATAQTTDPMTRYKQMTSVTPARCAVAPATDEIVVCAPNPRQSPRLPYPQERVEPGERPRLVAGEVPVFSARSPCPPRGCPGKGSIIGAIVKLVDRIRD
jgi:hypothetical protein